MSNPDRDAVLERLARLNALLDHVEATCADSAELRTTILRARAELQATTRSLHLATARDFDGEKD